MPTITITCRAAYAGEWCPASGVCVSGATCASVCVLAISGRTAHTHTRTARLQLLVRVRHGGHARDLAPLVEDESGRGEDGADENEEDDKDDKAGEVPAAAQVHLAAVHRTLRRDLVPLRVEGAKGVGAGRRGGGSGGVGDRKRGR